MSLTPHSRSIVCMWHLQMTSSLPIVCCPSISLFPFSSPIFSAHSLPRCICKCSTRLSFTALLCVYGCLSTIERKLNCYVYASILQCFAMYYCELFDRWHWVYSWFSTGCQVDSKVYFLKLCACEGRLGGVSLNCFTPLDFKLLKLLSFRHRETRSKPESVDMLIDLELNQLRQ